MDEQIGKVFSPSEAMKLAISEAHKGKPFVSPNPPVGCVVLDSENRLLSQGHHKIYGGPHAEVEAIQGLSKEQLQGAQVFVTLEPCAHEGKTPSCAKMLAKLPIKKVIYGLQDPNPLVAGQGAEILKAAGIETTEFQNLKKELEEVCEIFLHNYRQKEIFIALKVASSLDGQMALKSGESQWITGEESRQYVHYLRSCYDAVVVGHGTVKIDNPSLNVRHPEIKKENKVVVLDPQGLGLKTFSQLKLAQTHSPQNIFWCVDKKLNLKSQGPQLVELNLSGSIFDINELKTKLWEKGIRSLFVEGGSQTYVHFLNSGWAHRLYLFMAPHLMGAGGGVSWTRDLIIEKMQQRIELFHPEFMSFGKDILFTAKFFADKSQ